MTGRTLFVTGTDTGCGKTTATCALARWLVGRGRTVACFKPVATGCESTDQGLRNGDALALMEAAGIDLDYATVNPYAMVAPIAPHIAAQQAGIRFDLDAIAGGIRAIEADYRLVEGVGGWLVPLDRERLLPDLARALDAEVVLVVGLKLGCLNHALLTARAIAADGFRLAGWIANAVDPHMAEVEANLEALRERIEAPLLARLAYRPGGGPLNLDRPPPL